MYNYEYKVVCDRTEFHNYNGKVIVKKGVMCLYKGDYCKRCQPVDSYKKAKKWYDAALKGCPLFDKKMDVNDKDAIRTKQQNIRILCREVSDWF